MIDLLENILISIVLVGFFFCFFMTILTAVSPTTPPPPPPPPAENVVKITNPEPNEIHIIIKTVPADAGTQKE